MYNFEKFIFCFGDWEGTSALPVSLFGQMMLVFWYTFLLHFKVFGWSGKCCKIIREAVKSVQL